MRGASRSAPRSHSAGWSHHAAGARHAARAEGRRRARRRRRRPCGLAPAPDIRRIAIGSDHSGVALKAVLRDELRGRGLAVEMSAPKAPIRSTIRTSPPRSRGWSRAGKRTPASSSTAPGWDRRLPPTRSTGCARRCAPTGRWRATRASTTAPTCWRSAQRSSPPTTRGRSSRRGWHADARGALHPAAREDPNARENAITSSSSRRVLRGVSDCDSSQVTPDDRLLTTVSISSASSTSSSRSSPPPAPWRRSRCACHGFCFDCCPQQVGGVLAAGASRLGLHAIGRRRRGSRRADRSHAAQAGRDGRRDRETLPRGGRVSLRHRVCQSDLGRVLRAAAARHRRRRVLGRRISAGRDDARRQAVRDAARRSSTAPPKSTW